MARRPGAVAARLERLARQHRVDLAAGVGDVRSDSRSCVVSSASLEWTRLYQWEAQVAGGNAGGVVGVLLGKSSQSLLGFAGSGVLWIAGLVAGASLAFRFSWLRVADAIGAWIESLRTRRVERIERAEDARLGAEAMRERDEVLEVEHELQEQHLPIVIEPTLVDVPKSTRVVKERQKPLFSELVDTKLPQVDLLDSAPQRVESVSADSLEMTSRLIEKRLKDFGVEVRVVAASPGPVITRYEIEPAVGVKGAQVVSLAKDLARSLEPGLDPRRRDDPRQDDDGARAAQRQAPDDPPLGSARLAGLRRLRLAAHHRPGQGHRRQPDRRRPAEDAALPGGRHHGRGQVGRHQRDDPVARSTRPRRATCA